MYICLCHSVHCSKMLRSAKIWSVHPLHLRNPACSFLSFLSIASVRCCSMIFAMILLGIDRSVIPRQLLQSLKLPLFDIFIIIPSDQSSGISFFSQIVLNSGWSILEASSGSALKRSAFRLSCPGAFPFFRDLMSKTISSFVGGLIPMSSSFSACWTSGSVVGDGLFRTSWKGSTHQASCCNSFVYSWHFLSSIGASVVRLCLPLTILVIL